MVTHSAAGPFAFAPAVLAAYLVLAVLAPALCKRWGRTALMACGSLPLATTVWAAAQLPAVLDGGGRQVHVDWIPTLSIAIDLRLDALSLVLALVVAGVGTLVFLYSGRYFPADDDGLGKYTGALLAFAGSMLGLVLADNLLLLVIFWELTGVLSYLLIAHRSGKRTSRVAATQAFIVTTAGGLVMLVGAVMLGENAGTYTLSVILAAPPSGPWITSSVVLLIVGGITKSAIVPFSFWLPGAMAAPTPASAFLHAATMVKAGIYLFARLAPAFAVLPLWQPVLMVLGGVTLIYGGVVALRQRDLKLLLAYGTVSQLGLMTLLIGTGSPDALLGGLAMLIAHATFKAALFFVVGVIDTATGTRDLTQLSGLRRSMPVMFWVTVLTTVSMAGVPPMIGFAAKEAGYAGILAGGSWGTAGAVVMTAGSALTVAYSLRFLWAAFADKPGRAETEVSPSSPWMTGPAVGLAAVGLILGLAPYLLEPLVQSYAGTAGPTHPDAMALWHGFTLPLALSVAGWALGALIFVMQRRGERSGEVAAPATVDPGRSYRATTAGVDAVAVAVTNATQRGSLPVSLGAILVVLVAFPGTMLITAGVAPRSVEIVGDPAQVLLSVVILALAVVLLRVRRGMVAIMLVGGVGYAVAVLFILRGAPDLALTQLLVETVTLVAGLLVLTRMPDRALFASRKGNGFRAVVAVFAGVLMTALALIIPGTRTVAPISEALPGPSVSYGGGYNIVNVILVDVRGWDTFGEISVLIAAATGVASLVFLSRRTGSVPRRPTALPKAAKPRRPSPWLATDWTPRRSLLLEVVTRLIFHIIVVFSLYVLFVGHDQPGGGFAAGLIVGLALTLRYLAGGAFELGEAAPVDAGIVMGLGLLIAAVMAVVGLLGGGSALQSTIFQGEVLGLDLKFVTSTIFDIGVFLVVVGLVLDVLRSLGAELDRQAVLDRLGGNAARTRSGRTAVSARGRRR